MREVIVGAATEEAVERALALYERKETIIFAHPRWTDHERDRNLARIPDTQGAAAVFFTSGTTGEPKPVLHTSASIEASCRAVLKRLGAGANERWLCALPIAHVGGFAVVMRARLSNAQLIIGSEKDLARATVASLVPTMLHRLLERGFSRADAKDLHTILLGGAPASDVLLARAKTAGFGVITTYGMTETFGGIAFDGVPLDGVDVRITPEHTIAVRGPMLMMGVDGAFFDTQDLGELDAVTGKLRVLSRRTELIITGGENVHPAEVEAALEASGLVARACVFGVRDETWGEVVCAAIVPKPSFEQLKLDVHLARVLAPFKRPRRFAIVAELPETPQGKLDRAKVRTLVVDTKPLGRDTRPA